MRCVFPETALTMTTVSIEKVVVARHTDRHTGTWIDPYATVNAKHAPTKFISLNIFQQKWVIVKILLFYIRKYTDIQS